LPLTSPQGGLRTGGIAGHSRGQAPGVPVHTRNSGNDTVPGLPLHHGNPGSDGPRFRLSSLDTWRV